jgi:ABC-type glycerol-3-phosphate transport system substrate-binding protein
MKNWISLILAVLMALTLTACDGGKTPAGSAGQEEGQNPVMNYVGTYGSDRATMLVEASEADSAKITVSWSSSAAEHSEWVMRAGNRNLRRFKQPKWP